MLDTLLALGIAAAFCFGAASAWAEPPGHARSHAEVGQGGLLDRVIDTVRGAADLESPRQRQNPNSNAQWLPDATRGQARAAQRRPAHAGPQAQQGGDGLFDLLDFGLGEEERQARAKHERKRKQGLDKLRRKHTKRTKGQPGRGD